MKHSRIKEVGYRNYTITRSQCKVVPNKNDNMSTKPRDPLTSSVPHHNYGTPITRTKSPIQIKGNNLHQGTKK